MESLAKALGRFLSRDILYVAAGSLMVSAAAAGAGFNLNDLNIGIAIIGLVAGYAVCYVTQEVLGTVWLVSLKTVSPPDFRWKIFNIGTQLESSLIEGKTQDDLESLRLEYWALNPPPPDRIKEQIERYIFLQDVCVKFGTSFMSAPLIFSLTRKFSGQTAGMSFDWWQILLLMIPGLILCLQSSFRSNQTAWFMIQFLRSRKDSSMGEAAQLRQTASPEIGSRD